MLHIAICFGYLPMVEYTGFSKQLHDKKNLYTIIVETLKNARLINNETNANVRLASRTDRGVGAIYQVVSLFTDHNPIIAEINSYLPNSIRALGYNEVPKNFNPRKDALLRTYSYFLSTHEELDLFAIRTSLGLLVGKHDFQNFAKNDTKKEVNTIKDVELAKIFPLNNNTYHIRIASKSFLWQQIRRIIGHLIDISDGKYDIQYTLKLLENDSIITKPSPVPPQYLILEKIHYKSVKFNYDQKSLRQFRQMLMEQLIQARSNSGLYSFLMNYFTDLKKE